MRNCKGCGRVSVCYRLDLLGLGTNGSRFARTGTAERAASPWVSVARRRLPWADSNGAVRACELQASRQCGQNFSQSTAAFPEKACRERLPGSQIGC